MHPRQKLLFGLLIAAALAAGWWMSSSKPVRTISLGPPIIPSKPAKPAVALAPAPPAKITPPSPPPPPPVLPPAKPAVVEAPPPAASPAKTAFAPAMPSVALDARKRYAEDLEQVGLMLRDYRTLMKENPVGSNAEIMAALMGRNPKHAQLGPPAGAGLNDQGELLDRWGTPYFFHQISAKVMEIRSAGPDQKMWTSDDPVVR